MKQTKRGLFITFEGPDGCGKSTQAIKLHNYAFSRDKYNHMVLTREPWGDTNLRNILKQDQDPYSKARLLAELFVRDRKEHLDKIIQPNLEKGLHVISDRYSFSTLAYQHTQGMPLKELIEMHQGCLVPDLIYIVDVPVEVAIERMKKDSDRSEEQKFERDPEFMEKLRKNYLGLEDELDYPVVVVDGKPGKEEIFQEQVKPAFDKLWEEYLRR
jgi:dTMP kinase